MKVARGVEVNLKDSDPVKSMCENVTGTGITGMQEDHRYGIVAGGGSWDPRGQAPYELHFIRALLNGLRWLEIHKMVLVGFST